MLRAAESFRFPLNLAHCVPIPVCSGYRLRLILPFDNDYERKQMNNNFSHHYLLHGYG
jgi:hypothetical protein